MDWDTIRNLLEIVELSRGHPQLKVINDAALAELNSLANPPKQEEEPVEETEEPEKEPEDE